jgi:protein-disulfide isomerase
MKVHTRKGFCWLTVLSMGAASIAIIYQVLKQAIDCDGLICQLRYAATYSRAGDLALGAILLLQAGVLFITLILLRLNVRRLQSLARATASILCITGVLVALRIALVETVLLHAWSLSCVAAGWLCVLLLGWDMTAILSGRLGSKLETGLALVGAVVVGVLSWHLMQEAGIPRVTVPDLDRRIVASAHSYSLGPTSAPLQIVEFADFRCPPCRRLAPELRTLASKYPETIRLTQRELPNEKHHPQANRAAEIAECFGEQGKFWDAAPELYRAAAVPTDTQLESWFTRLRVAAPQFRACMAQHRTRATILKDRLDARELGVSATPTLFVGDTKIEGQTSMDKLEGLLRAELVRERLIAKSVVPKPLAEQLAPPNGCVVQWVPDANGQKEQRDTHCR